MHYTKLFRAGKFSTNLIVCSVLGCEQPVAGKSVCSLHWQRLKRTGELGQAASLRNLKGEGGINSGGYLRYTRDGKEILGHREVAEKALGKPLPLGSIVHHLNGDKLDNRLHNLVVCPDESYHQLLHKRQKELGWAGPEHTDEWKAKQALGASLTLENLFSRS
jgi:hypothetical protein